MKKLSLYLWLLSVAFYLPLKGFAQSTIPEQDAIRKTIEGETAAIDQCDYARWADHWWPETYCYFSATSPQRHWSMHGWDEISTWAKNTTGTGCSPITNDHKKRDYKYALNGNMAFVTLLEEEGNESTRVLEKRDGKWKLIQMGVVISSSYTSLEQIKELQQFAGKWKADISTMKKEVSSQGREEIDFYFENEATETGIRLNHWRHWKDAEGIHKYSRRWEIATIAGSEEMGLFVVHNDSDGWSGVIHGTAKLGKEGLNAVLENSVSEWFILKPDGKLQLIVDNIDDTGKTSRRFSVDMVKQ